MNFCKCGCKSILKGKNSKYAPGHNPNSRLLNLEGKKFGKLLVLKKVKKPNRTAAHWLCKCDCGNEVIIAGWTLRNRRKSCGCGKKLNRGESNFKRLFSHYQNSALQRYIPFNLTENEFKNLTKGNCFYCGSEPNQIMGKNRRGNGTYIYNGLDRVNNNVGYIRDNVVSCCKFCNTAKKDLPQNVFINQIAKIYNFSRIGYE